RLLRSVPAPGDTVVRVEDVHHARHARLRRPAARVAGEHHAAGGRAVVRAGAGPDLGAAGRPPRQPYAGLVRPGAAVGEEEHVDVAWRDLGELRAEPGARLGGHERVRVGQRLDLLLHRAHDALVAVADVHAHQLAVEIDETLAFRRPEVDP